MVNTSYPELQETKVAQLPPASLDTLKKMREDACSSSSFAFKLQPQQRFLRRVLSPDSPTQNILVVHGTGVGKTCSAIQVAEEYIIRPEFQDKKVLVIANPSIQDNFKNQIFDVSRVNVDAEGLLTSKQCSGRRYLDILQRGQRQPLKLSTREQQEQLQQRASKILNEFYEFQGYGEFANILEKQKLHHTTNDINTWIHATFDNRLVIVDEAHNLRESSETTVDAKLISTALKHIIQTAIGITLVLLTATPMYDRFEEIFDYFNLFLWNSRQQSPSKALHASDFFESNGDFVSADAEHQFRSLCETFISYVKGENPFAFPFRLPPPDELLAPRDRTTDTNGVAIKQQIQYIPLTQSIVSSFQADCIRGLTLRGLSEYRTICTFPDNKSLTDVMEKRETQYWYRDVKFLAPSMVATYSSKFALITKILDSSTGIVFIYSNLAELGVQLFAMCLEEHGYTSVGDALLGDPSGEIAKGTKGRYALITSQSSDVDIGRILNRLRQRQNMNGDDIRVILASPKVSEGVDFRYVRQIHILDPWFNMSRIEQVIGRGMRVCSHSLLPFEDQNTTVYLHVCRYPDSTQETLDETIYRSIVEQKGIAIAKVKRVIMESAMDCTLEHAVNELPVEWKTLKVPQKRNQDQRILEYPIESMTSPSFLESTVLECKTSPSKKEDHVRPLSAILDVRDEIIDKLLTMIVRKPIWTFKDFYASAEMKQYDSELISYILQNLIESRTVLKDSYGRNGVLDAKKGILSFSIRDTETMQDKSIDSERSNPIPLPSPILKEEEPKQVLSLQTRILATQWPAFANEFSMDVKEWYVVDHMPHEEKVQYILSVQEPYPLYIAPLKTKSLTIMSPTEIYNADKELITPIGPEKDEYEAWKQALRTKFLATRESFYGSLKGYNLIFNVDEKAIPAKKVERSKSIGGRTCAVYPVGVLQSFITDILGGSFPPDAKNRGLMCYYLDLKLRACVLEKKEGLVWYTPEEWTVLDEMKKTLK